VKSAEAQVESARGRYESAQAQVTYSEIRSPISGIIADRPIYPGEMAAAGAPLLTVVDVSRVIARVNVSANEAAALHPGDPATIHAPNGDAPGKVTVVSPAVDPQSTTVEVWVEAENPNALLKPGASVQTSILAQTIDNALVIPAEALLPAQDASNEVLVVGADSVVHERKVQIGVKDAGKVQVLDGLHDGESVVTVGGVGVQDGAKVRVGGANE
jgi:RND family efflux transporter MFP subunit